MPPSTKNDEPVTNEASSEARKSAALAISSASPKRPIGTWTKRRWRFSSVCSSEQTRVVLVPRVRWAPGARASDVRSNTFVAAPC